MCVREGEGEREKEGEKEGEGEGTVREGEGLVAYGTSYITVRLDELLRWPLVYVVCRPLVV